MRLIIIFLILLCVAITNAQDSNIDSSNEVIRLEVSNPLQIAWSPDSSKIAVLTFEHILVWDTEDWKLAYSITDTFAYAIAWHPSSQYLAGLHGGREERISIWGGETGELEKSFVRQLPDDMIGIVVLDAIAWSHDGKYIASDSGIDTLVLWDTETGEHSALVPLFEPVLHNIIELSWSSTDKFILSGAIDKTIRIWDSQNGEEILQVEGYKHIAWHSEEDLFAGAFCARLDETTLLKSLV